MTSFHQFWVVKNSFEQLEQFEAVQSNLEHFLANSSCLKQFLEI